jgi:hypothetical protein
VDAGLVAYEEMVVELASDAIVAEINAAYDAYGERPFGWIKGDVWQQLDAYLDLRADPLAITTLRDEWALAAGLDKAEALLMRELTRMEHLLAEKVQELGVDGLQMELLRRRIERGRPALEAAQDILAKPKAVFAPLYAFRTDVELLAELVPDVEPVQAPVGAVV